MFKQIPQLLRFKRFGHIIVSTEIKRPLSDELLFGKLEHGGHVLVDHDGEKLTFACEPAPEPPADAPAA